jgi:hypothetical protein
MRERLGISELYASLILLIIVSSMGVVVYSYAVETTLGYESYFIDRETRESKRVMERVTILSVLWSTISDELNITVYNYGKFDTSIIEIYVNDIIVENYYKGLNDNIISLGIKELSFESPVSIQEGEQYTIIIVSKRGVTDTYIWKN